MLRSVVLLLSLVASIQGFTCSTGPAAQRQDTTALNALSRAQFMSVAAAGLGVAMTPVAAYAGDVDPSKKGTKDDPAYQLCLSQCMYDCTKPKGEETKLRKECLPECKVKCATTKQQLMMGTPVGGSK